MNCPSCQFLDAVILRVGSTKTALGLYKMAIEHYLGRNAWSRDGITPILIRLRQSGLRQSRICSCSCSRRRNGAQSENLETHDFPNKVSDVSTKKWLLADKQAGGKIRNSKRQWGHRVCLYAVKLPPRGRTPPGLLLSPHTFPAF